MGVRIQFHKGIRWPGWLRCYRRTAIRSFAFTLALLCNAGPIGVQAEPTASAQAGAPVKFGLLPHLSNQLLIRKYQPLIDYLEESLQRPVLVSTAPDFATYIERATQGRYDLYLTAPHMAAYHEIHDGHQRLARFSRELRGLILVAESSPYHALADLKGKQVSAPDPLAVITLSGEVTLQNRGLVLDRNVTIKYTPSHNNAIRSVTEGKTSAAIAGFPAYKIVLSSGQLGAPIRILSKTDAIPHMMFMSPPRVIGADVEQYRSVLLNFTPDGAGENFFKNTPFGSLAPISDQDMERLAEMLQLLEQRLNK